MVPDTNEVFSATEFVNVSAESAETVAAAVRVIVIVYEVDVPF